MDPKSSLELAGLGILLIFSIIFSASETALISLGKIRLRSLLDREVKGSKKIEKIMKDPKKLLTTILIGNNIVNISASALMTSIIISSSNGTQKHVVMGTIVLTIAILIFGEITPKTLAQQKAEKISILVAPFINVCMILLVPVADVLNLLSGIFIKILGGDLEEEEITITEDQLKTIVDVSHEEGVLEDDEKDMINNIFEFGDSTAREIMTPRTEIIAVSKAITYDDLIEMYRDEKISRLPVYNETIDDIIGVVYIKDIIFLKDVENFKVEKFLRDVCYTYESKDISGLFADMRKKRNSITIVIDEYGGTAGLVTSHDLVEEIFGDIHDEDDDEGEEFTRVSETEFEVDGTVRIDDFEEITEVKIETENFETIGGYVIGLFGYIPVAKEEVVDDTYKIKFLVEKIEKNRIDKIRVIKL